MLRLWQAYTRFLQAHPFKAQAANTFLLMGIGDVMAQQVIEKAGFRKHNVIRTLRQASFGLFIAGPLLFTWYSTLDKVVTGIGAVKVFKMVALDQALMAPFIIATFFTVIGFTSGMSALQIKDKLKQDFKPTLVTNYKIWPAVQVINFYFIPLQHRVLAVNCVALFWNTYLSWMVNARRDEDQEGEISDEPSETVTPT